MSFLRSDGAGKRGRKAVVGSLVAALVLSTFGFEAAGAGKRRGPFRYQPPYKLGPQGGDQYNEVHADRETGQITIVRTFPWPGSFGCIPESEAAWANFEVIHRKRKRPARRVIVKYENAELDGYGWITLFVRNKKGRWLGSDAVQGPLVGATGKIKTRVRKRGRTGKIRIQFGLQVASACPQAEAMHVAFPKVKVRMRRGQG